jgi:ABC-type glycerol-3-phosphate transport system substrate-binding protein
MDQSTQGSFQKFFMIGGFVFGVLGIFVFSISQFGKNNVDPALTGTINVWGTLPGGAVNEMFYQYSQDAKTYNVVYTEQPESKIVDRYIEAVANGQGPDLMILPDNIAVPLRIYANKFPDSVISETTFKNTYVRSTYNLFGPTGVFAFPIGIDPLVMYVNTDIMTNAAFQTAPKTWGDIPLFVSRVLGFTTTDNNDVQRAIALGSMNNILRNREILLTLLFQLKNDVIERFFTSNEDKDGNVTYQEHFRSVFGINDEEHKIKNDLLAEQVFVFFTSFVDPNIKEAYTWSKKAPMDRDLFASGNLGIYFGLSTDRQYIDSKNPHLNYEIDLVPGPKGDTAQFRSVNYAKVYSLLLMQKTNKPMLAYKVLQDILAHDFVQKLDKAWQIAPARQDMLYATTTDATGQVFYILNQKARDVDVIYKAADRGDILMEPLPNLANQIFGSIVDALSGSRQTPSEIIKNAELELTRQLKD